MVESHDAYRQDIRAFPLLTKAQEAQLSNRIRVGNEARDSLRLSVLAILLAHMEDAPVQLFLDELKAHVPNNIEECLRLVEIRPPPPEQMSETDARKRLLFIAFACAHSRRKLALTGIQSKERAGIVKTLLCTARIVDEEGKKAAIAVSTERFQQVLSSKERIAQMGDRAKNTLMSANLRLVGTVAVTLQGRGMDLEDLISLGNIGLAIAVEQFDGRLGYKFSTYAWNWIHQAMQRGIASNDEIRVPVDVDALMQRFRFDHQQLQIQRQKPMSPQEALTLLPYTNVERGRIERVFAPANIRSFSGEAKGTQSYGGLDNNDALFDSTADPKTPTPKEAFFSGNEQTIAERSRILIESALELLHRDELLNGREVIVLSKRLGVNDCEPQILEDIGDSCGVTRERIRQIEAQALPLLQTMVAILCCKEAAQKEALQNPHARYRHLLPRIKILFLRRQLGNMSYEDDIPTAQRKMLRSLIEDILPAQLGRMLNLGFGFDGESKHTSEIATIFGINNMEVRVQCRCAYLWLKVALESSFALRRSAFQKAESGHALYAVLEQTLKEIERKKIVEIHRENGRATHERITHRPVFLDALPATIDMDTLAAREHVPLVADEREKEVRAMLRTADNDDKQPASTTIPPWMKKLSEQTATQLHSLLMRTDLTLRQVLDFLENTSDTAPIPQKLQKTIAQRALLFPDTLAALLRAHVWSLDVLPEIPGEVIKSPTALRGLEFEHLLVPNLRNIIGKHFEEHPVPLAERRLIDVGAWDGRLTAALADLFGEVVAIEPNAKRFGQLAKRESSTFHIVQKDLQSILMAPEIIDAQADVILLSHVLYFLKYEDDEQALLWAQSTLKENGIAITVLNDVVPERPSRTHLRQQFSPFETNPWPSRYQRFLQGHGIATDVIRATLALRSQSERGLTATKDILRYLIPGRARHNGEGTLDGYMDRFVRDRGGIGSHLFPHTVYFLVGHEQSSVAFKAKEVSDTRFDGLLEELKPAPLAPSPPPPNLTQEKVVPPASPPAREVPQHTALTEEIEHTPLSESLRIRDLIGRVLRIRYGRRVRSERPTFARKREFRTPYWIPSNKRNELDVQELRKLESGVAQLRRDAYHAINEKTGEIVIDGHVCVEIMQFAALYELDGKVLRDVVQALGLPSRGSALKKSRELPVYDLDLLCTIPYVRARRVLEQEHFLDAVPDPLVPWRERYSPFLREIDANLESDTREANALEPPPDLVSLHP